jgi:hypothetical protein
MATTENRLVAIFVTVGRPVASRLNPIAADVYLTAHTGA